MGEKTGLAFGFAGGVVTMSLPFVFTDMPTWAWHSLFWGGLAVMAVCATILVLKAVRRRKPVSEDNSKPNVIIRGVRMMNNGGPAIRMSGQTSLDCEGLTSIGNGGGLIDMSDGAKARLRDIHHEEKGAERPKDGAED